MKRDTGDAIRDGIVSSLQQMISSTLDSYRKIPIAAHDMTWDAGCRGLVLKGEKFGSMYHLRRELI